jgi:hypothetical protein
VLIVTVITCSAVELRPGKKRGAPSKDLVWRVPVRRSLVRAVSAAHVRRSSARTLAGVLTSVTHVERTCFSRRWFSRAEATLEFSSVEISNDFAESCRQEFWDSPSLWDSSGTVMRRPFTGALKY